MRTLLLASLLLFLISGCKKNNKDLGSDSIYGTWELRKTEGGMVGPMNYPPGNGNKLKITSSAYAMYINDSLVHTTPITISTGTNPQTGKDASKLTDSTGYAFYADVIAGRLHIYHGTFALDGVMNIYARLSEADGD